MSHNAKPKGKSAAPVDHISQDMMSEKDYANMPKGSKTRRPQPAKPPRKRSMGKR
jgi:hypothetical protein